jgi:hypothetical protein
MVFAALFGVTLNAALAVTTIVSFFSVEKGIREGLLEQLPQTVVQSILYGLVCGSMIFLTNSYILFLFLYDLLDK